MKLNLKKAFTASLAITVALFLLFLSDLWRLFINTLSGVVIGGADWPTLQFAISQALKQPSGITLQIAFLATLSTGIVYLIQAKKQVE